MVAKGKARIAKGSVTKNVSESDFYEKISFTPTDTELHHIINPNTSEIILRRPWISIFSFMATSSLQWLAITANGSNATLL